MNLLKVIKIKGEVFSEYAYLTFDFKFESDNAPSGADYIFRLPKDACISNVKIIGADGSLINTKIVPTAHIAKLNGFKAFAYLRQTDSDTYILSIDRTDRAPRVVISVYTRAESIGTAQRLTVPLAVPCFGADRAERLAQIDIMLHGINADSVKSVSHSISVHSTTEGAYTSANNISADRDFCIEYADTKRVNSAIAATDGICGEMLCRIYPDSRFFNGKYKKFLFICDTGGLLSTDSAAAKEFICRAAALCEEFAIITADETPHFITDGFCKYPGSDDELYKTINSIGRGGALSAAFEYAGSYVDSDVLPVLISGSLLTEGQPAVDSALKNLRGSKLCAVTFGAYGHGGYAEQTSDLCGGKHINIYAGEAVSTAAVRAMQAFSNIGIDGIKLYAGSYEGTIAEYPSSPHGALTAVIPYNGDVPHTEFTLELGEISESVSIDKMQIYKSFAPIGLLYADIGRREIERRLQKCDADEVPELKHRLEKLGVKYSALNTETMYLAELGGSDRGVIRTMIAASGINPAQETSKKTSVFGVEEAAAGEAILGRCAEMLIASIHSDGAICPPGETDANVRRRETLIYLLALYAAGRIEESGKFARAAQKYICGFTFSGIEYTADRKRAAKMLKDFFGNENVPPDSANDIYTAARLLVGAIRT